MIGSTVSHYRVTDKLDVGGMGVIFKAEDTRLGRVVALKFLPAQFSDDDAAKARLVQEAKAASALDHPNICTIYEVGETEDGQLFIAMALYEGETLKKKIARGPLGVEETVDYVQQIAEGLQCSHDQNIIHRDIKPANIIVTGEGQIKILDFGLAKILGGSVLSVPGLAQGTPAYMAPERIRDEKATPQTDLWSLGVIFYEALVGQRPFQGDNLVATIQAIHTVDPELLDRTRAEVGRDLAALVDRLLRKEPRERYKRSADLLRDLAILDDRVSGSLEFLPRPAVEDRRRHRRQAVLGLVAALLLVTVSYFGKKRLEAPASADGPPTLAILFFENPAGDPDLDWLRTGLPQMLVSDLSQSPRLRVLSTRQIHQLMNGDDDPVDLPAFIGELVERTHIDQVLIGSVVKDGEELRISIEVQEAASGRILKTHVARGAIEENLLSMVDDLSLDIRRNLELGIAASNDPDLHLEKITSASLEAWEAYIAGMQDHLVYNEAAAATWFHRAVEIDPEFSLAWAKLAVVSRNLGRPEAKTYAARALEGAERLSPRERYYIEGFHAIGDVRTWSRAIESFEKALEVEPEHHAARQSLAVILSALERYDEAIEQGEILLEKGNLLQASFATLAEAYAARGDILAADELISNLVRRRSEDFVGHLLQGRLYQRWGRLDEAFLSFERAEAVQPGTPVNFSGMCANLVLRKRFQEALDLVASRRGMPEAVARVSAAQCHILVAGYRGDSALALQIAGQLIAAIPSESVRFPVRLQAARIHLERGEIDAAFEEATIARRESRTHPRENEATLAMAMAAIAGGRFAEAEGLATEVGALAAEIPSIQADRHRGHVLGLLALERGDTVGALTLLEAAAESLPQRGVRAGSHEPDHVLLWWSLSAAHRAAGDVEAAAAFLRRIVNSIEERLTYPSIYVKSLYLLGDFHQARGEDASARDYFEQFLGYWEEGDLASERVQRALAEVSAARRSPR